MVLVAVLVGVRLTREPDVNALLAQAYTEQRNMELRISGAQYAGLRVQRGTEQSLLNRPAPLLKAEELIGNKLASHPLDPVWLQAKARADLLDNNYEPAIQSLERALQIQPDSPSMLTDLASAYFQRAKATDRPIDYGSAVEFLGKALAKSPDDPVALFNRAIACEHAFLYTEAIDDWEHYLRVDPNGPWADEARQRMAALRDKVKGHAKSMAEPLLTAKELAVADARNLAFRAEVDSRIEEYLHLAIREWLPAAYPVNIEQILASVDFRGALFVLADIAEKDHQDPWLRDLLSASASQDFAKALTALAGSVAANDVGDYTAAQHKAIQAERLFVSARNPAGMMRARVENVYALHLSHEGTRCLRAIETGKNNINSSPYQWLQVQFHIEQAICLGLMGDIGEAQRLLKQAVADGAKVRYNTLYLRALGNQSELEVNAGNLVSGWLLASNGIRMYWSRPVQTMQGYNLYVRLYLAAELNHQPYLEVAIWRQALAMIDTNEDLLLRAMAHSTMVEAALDADFREFANHEFAEANRLFAAAPQTEPTNNDRIEAQIRLAAVETRHQDTGNALVVLDNLHSAIRKLSNVYLAAKFYSTLGEVQIQRDARPEAEAALRAAIALAELHLESLRSEQERATWSQLTANTYRNMVRLKLYEGDTEGALELWEWYRGAPLRTRKHHRTTATDGLSHELLDIGPPLPDLHQVANQLPSLVGETIISYAAFRDGLAIWVYDNRGIAVKWVAKPSREISQLVFTLLQQCSEATSDQRDIRENAHALYDLIIGPVEDRLSEERTLVFEPDGPLDHLPIDVLIDGHSKTLIDRMSIVNSLGLYYRNSQHPQLTITSRTPALVIGVSNSTDNTFKELPPLIDVEREAESVASNFEFVRLLKGKQATLNAVLSDLPGAVVFHFAGHAVSSSGRSGLVLDDKLLTASFVESARATRTVLAVLSACDTEKSIGTGRYDNDSLARRFLMVGISHVVASRWKVDSASTVLFMKSFYAALLNGKSVSQSVRLAKISLRSHLETSHPYYWAAFAAFGSS